MNYFRKLIEESEKQRILGMHNNFKSRPKVWVIKEAYSAQPGEGFDSVEACKKELPYNVATKLGINWKQAKTGWGSDGSSQQNLVLRDAMCDGWRIGDPKDGETQKPTGEQPGATGEQPGATGEQPGATGEQPGATGEQPKSQGKQKFIEPIF